MTKPAANLRTAATLTCLLAACLVRRACCELLENERTPMTRKNLRALQENKIPHNMWFTYKNNLLETKSPSHLYKNVQRTIQRYQDAWNDNAASVNFLDDTACAAEVAKAEPDLLPYFEHEESGPFRGDICRAAVLYLYGGYYFDVDIQVVEVFEPTGDESFVSAFSCGGNCIFNSFMASSPRHPLMKAALQELLDVYQDALDTSLLGPATMAKAYFGLPEEERADIRLMEEIELQEGDYPDLQRQDGWGKCNFVVHDPEAERVYWWTRFPGAGSCFTNKKNLKSTLPRIPHRFWFIAKENHWESKEPKPIYDNIVNTINVYRDAWEDRYAPVNFLTDAKCEREINKSNPKLLPLFRKETNGNFKADICKIAVMWLYGGYYFDVDLKAVDAYVPKDDYFVSVTSCGGGCFFSSYIASVKKHKILEYAMDELFKYYESDEETEMLGSIAFANAYERLKQEKGEEDASKGVTLFEELNLGENDYPHVPRQIGEGNCNWVVHNPNPAVEQVYFFSRFVGYPGCSPLPPTEEQ